MKKPSSSPGRKSRRAPPAAASAVAEVSVESLGAQGDGLAHWSGRTLFVPGTAPGDRVRVSVGLKRGDGYEATVLSIIEKSATRTDPFCPYFGACGGCAVQHVTPSVYAAWKRGMLVEAFRRRGFAGVEVDDLVVTPLQGRRRVTLSFERRGGDVRFGFNARFSHRIVDVDTCPLLVPELDNLMPAIRRVIAESGWAGGQAALTRAESGVDLLLTVPDSLDLDGRERLAAFADAHDLARVSWQASDRATPEPVAWRRHVRMTFGGVAVDLPPAAFLQPSDAGERILVDLVLQGAAGARKVADLYCGSGTFTFALARTALVLAVDATTAQVSALETAAGRGGCGGRVRAEVRDLDRRPMMAADLHGVEAVVFDPPRAGAKAQAETLAGIKDVARVVAVSCNPSTLARDVRILVDGGFRLTRIVPVDQFPHAGHVEAVAVLNR